MRSGKYFCIRGAQFVLLITAKLGRVEKHLIDILYRRYVRWKYFNLNIVSLIYNSAR